METLLWQKAAAVAAGSLIEKITKSTKIIQIRK